ncbi:MAG: hypothetical protein GAK28_00140 [Luteibacter sp.]|uniref:hypothetical protein n=1 Tax=Luteibacter sp. TaxID=1886636 RepID=UPI001385D726|nr:hypothetical protein [Luteibacter sp.]KAF1009502.1 MAG: hypothetical protein GAK28_00140 [Luteibacter sp.]
MIEADDDAAEASARVDETSARAIEIACRHIAIHEPFSNAPLDVGDRDLADFARIGAARLVSREELLKMAERNLSRFVSALRSRAAIYPQLDAVRLSVLAHVALAIRITALLECKPLWTAIHNSRWDDAADELMLTKWPEKARNDDDRRRMLELARMMRTGDEPAQLVSA